MSGLGWRCVEAAAGLLDPCDRDAVLGDLAEAERGFFENLGEILGLTVRRQILLWKSSGPWLAAFAWALPCSFLLMGFSLNVSREFQSAFGAGTGRGYLRFFCELSLLIGWSWSGGYVAGSIARRTLWVTAAASILPCLYCLSKFRIEALPPACLILFWIPVAWGCVHGRRRERIAPKAAVLFAVALTVLAIPGWGGHRVFLVALLWPAWFMVARALNPGRI